MEMHQIRYFLAVAEALNFTKAAEKWNVTQPSLTRAIKLLEKELGGLLFHRERTNTHLSELGTMVKPHLLQIYDESHQAKRLAQDFAGLKKTALKLGIMCTIALDQIIDLIGSIPAASFRRRVGALRCQCVGPAGAPDRGRAGGGDLLHPRSGAGTATARHAAVPRADRDRDQSPASAGTTERDPRQGPRR